MISSTHGSRDVRFNESNVGLAARLATLRRVPGSDSFKMPDAHGQVLPQAAPHIPGISPSNLMNDSHASLNRARRNLRNRDTVIISGALYGGCSSQPHIYQGEPLPQGEANISRRKFNRLTKAPTQYKKLAASARMPQQSTRESCQGLKHPAISEQPPISRLQSIRGGYVEEPLLKSSFTGLQSSRLGRRRGEVLVSPTTLTTTQEDGSKTTEALCPMVKVTAPTPPSSREASIINTTQTKRSRHSRIPALTPTLGPVIPPRRPQASASLISASATVLSLGDMTYKEVYEREHLLASRLQRELMPTRANLYAARLKFAALEEEFIVQRAKASQKGKFAHHFKWLYELEQAKTNGLLEQLKQREESGGCSRNFEAMVNGEIVSSLRTETSHRHEVSGQQENEDLSPVNHGLSHYHEGFAELPCIITTNVRRGTSTSSHKVQRCPQSNPHLALRHSNGRPRIENIIRTHSLADAERRVTHELSSAASHQALRPSRPAIRIDTQCQSPRARHELSSAASDEVPHPLVELNKFLADDESFAANQVRYREIIRSNIEYQEPPSHFSDDSDSDMDSEDESFEGPESPKLLHHLAELAESPLLPFSRPDFKTDGDNGLYQLPNSPKLPTSPSTASLSDLSDLSSSDDGDSEGSPRATEAIYRFGPRRVEVVPAVFRVPLSGSTVDYKDPETDIVDVTTKMGGWEWCSVPDLGLRDPREYRKGE